jgi:hypothetical protein
MAPLLEKYLPPGCKFVPPDCPSECPVGRQRRQWQKQRRREGSPLQHSRPWSRASSTTPPQARSPLCSPPRSRGISPPRTRGCTPPKSRCSSHPKSRASSGPKSRPGSPALSYSCCRRPNGPCAPQRISRACSPMTRYSCPRTPRPRPLAESRPSPVGKVPRTPCSSPLHRVNPKLVSPSLSPLSRQSSPRPDARVRHVKPWNVGESGEGHPGCTFEEIGYKKCAPPPGKVSPLAFGSFEIHAVHNLVDPPERHHLHHISRELPGKLRPVHAPGDHSTLRIPQFREALCS